MSLRVSMQESKLKPVCLASRLNSLHLKWVKRICKPTVQPMLCWAGRPMRLTCASGVKQG